MSNQAFIQALLLQLFSPKDLVSLFLCLLRLLAPWDGHMVDTKGKLLEIWACRSLKNAFFLNLFGILEFYQEF